MGQIVAAMATMRVPQLFTRPPEEDLKHLDTGVAAMGRLGKLHVLQSEQRKLLRDAA